MFKRLSILVLISIGLLTASMVSAAGIGVAPQSLEIVQEPGGSTQTTISLHNTGETVALYEIYADEYERLIQIDSEEIRLTPGEGRAIPVTIASFPPGEYSTNISLVATEISDEELPKTGVKLPITITSSLIGEAETSMTYRQMSIILVLIAIVFFLIAIYLHHRKSKLQKFVDSAQATAASHSMQKTARYYKKKHPLMLVSLIALLLAGGLLIWSFVASNQPETTETQEQASIASYQVTIQTPEGAQLYPIETANRISAFTALELIRDTHGVSLAYDPPAEFGVFVTEIAGYENGQDNLYWVYEVNGEAIPLAADRHFLGPNDQLLWKFVEPSAEF